MNIKAADRIIADVKDDCFCTCDKMISPSPLGVASICHGNKLPPPKPFKWQGEWRIARGCFMGPRDMHVFWGRTHARVNAWVAN